MLDCYNLILDVGNQTVEGIPCELGDRAVFITTGHQGVGGDALTTNFTQGVKLGSSLGSGTRFSFRDLTGDRILPLPLHPLGIAQIGDRQIKQKLQYRQCGSGVFHLTTPLLWATALTVLLTLETPTAFLAHPLVVAVCLCARQNIKHGIDAAGWGFILHRSSRGTSCPTGHSRQYHPSDPGDTSPA